MKLYVYVCVVCLSVKYERNSRACHTVLRECVVYVVYVFSQGEETECPVCAGKEELFRRGMSEPDDWFPLTCSPLPLFFSRPLLTIKAVRACACASTRIRRCLAMGLIRFVLENYKWWKFTDFLLVISDFSTYRRLSTYGLLI